MLIRQWRIIRHEVELLRTSRLPLCVYFAMPVVVLAFIEGGFTIYLDAQDRGSIVGGADLAAPGLASMFVFMAISSVGFIFLGDHAWGTWTRVRLLGVRTSQLMIGKLSVAMMIEVALVAFVLGSAAALFGFKSRGPLFALSVAGLMLSVVAVSYCALGFAVCTNQAAFNAFTHLGALVMAGLGGALTPFETLPGWAQSIAPLVPTYWSVRAFEAVVLDGAGLDGIVVELAAMALFAAVFATLAYILFDEDKPRSTWA